MANVQKMLTISLISLAAAIGGCAEETPIPNLQSYQKLALKAAVAQHPIGTRNGSLSFQLKPYPMSTILATGRRELQAQKVLSLADSTNVCVAPLHQIQPEPTHDKRVAHKSAPGSGDIKTFGLLPVCRSGQRRP